MTDNEQNIEIMKDLRNRLDKVLNNTPTETSTVKHPDATNHFYVSLAKSLIRALAGFGLMFGFIIFAGMALVFAEILGIVEELV